MLFGSLILGVTDSNLYFRKVKTMQSNIKVVTENFRAIGHAAIQISGITVVAGENSSGKRTFTHNKKILLIISPLSLFINHYFVLLPS